MGTWAAVILVKPALPEPEKLFEIGVRVAFTLLAAFVVQRGLFLVVGRVERFVGRAGHGAVRAEQRARTLGQIFRNLCTVLVGSAALLHVLAIFGWDIRPLLAGAGILGVALGFGAQTLVRDVIAGFFILAENQYSVGDLIEANGKAATVEAITVRCTVLRDFNGFVHFVPNGEMKVVTNRSRGWNRLAVDMVVAPDQNLDRAIAACRAVVQEMNADPLWKERLLDPVDLWGVESVSSQEVQIRMVVRARPGADAPEASRELRRRVHRALNEVGIRVSPSRDVILTGPISAGHGMSAAGGS
jgi:small conductance mechanosensitive channel